MNHERHGVLPGQAEAHRALVHYWIKVLGAALAGGDDTALEAIAREVAGPRLQVKITTPLIPAEALALRQTLELLERHRVQEIGLNLVASCLLVRWLGEASGWTHTEILGRLHAELTGPTVPPSTRRS
ncbi:MAG: hypothetical protein GXX79_20245 [Actinomycetales bacterium]|nr:hypothetical protein [Actinomycetales bacterium]